MGKGTHGLGDSSGYEIRIKGHLGDRWSGWFEGLDLAAERGGTTVIRCPALDQAALHGLLRRIRDVGLPLLSVTRIGADGQVAAAATETPLNQVD